MCWQSRKAIPRCRCEWKTFAFFVCLEEGALRGRRGQRECSIYYIYIYTHIYVYICTLQPLNKGFWATEWYWTKKSTSLCCWPSRFSAQSPQHTTSTTLEHVAGTGWTVSIWALWWHVIYWPSEINEKLWEAWLIYKVLAAMGYVFPIQLQWLCYSC